MSGDVRNGTIVALMAVVLLNSSAARFCVLPGFVVAILRCPGCSRAKLMTSCNDFSGEPDRVTVRRSKNDVVEVDAKSVRILYGSELNSEARIFRIRNNGMGGQIAW